MQWSGDWRDEAVRVRQAGRPPGLLIATRSCDPHGYSLPRVRARALCRWAATVRPVSPRGACSSTRGVSHVVRSGEGSAKARAARGVYCTLPPQERDAHRTALDGLEPSRYIAFKSDSIERSIDGSLVASSSRCLRFDATLKTSRGAGRPMIGEGGGADGSPSLVEHAAAVDADDVGALLTAAQAPLASMPASAPPGAAGHAVPGGFRGGRQAAGVAFASASARLVARSAVQVVLADVEGSAVASGVPDAVALDGEWLEVTKGRTGVCSAVAWASARGLGPPLVRTACGRGRNPTSLLGVASALR